MENVRINNTKVDEMIVERTFSNLMIDNEMIRVTYKETTSIIDTDGDYHILKNNNGYYNQSIEEFESTVLGKTILAMINNKLNSDNPSDDLIYTFEKDGETFEKTFRELDGDEKEIVIANRNAEIINVITNL